MKKLLFAIQVITISLSLPAYIIVELSHDNRGCRGSNRKLQVNENTGTTKATASVENSISGRPFLTL